MDYRWEYCNTVDHARSLIFVWSTSAPTTLKSPVRETQNYRREIDIVEWASPPKHHETTRRPATRAYVHAQKPKHKDTNKPAKTSAPCDAQTCLGMCSTFPHKSWSESKMYRPSNGMWEGLQQDGVSSRGRPAKRQHPI